jgi:hypothetical protein
MGIDLKKLADAWMRVNKQSEARLFGFFLIRHMINLNKYTCQKSMSMTGQEKCNKIRMKHE